MFRRSPHRHWPLDCSLPGTSRPNTIALNCGGSRRQVLVRCWVGCDLKTVLKSAGLSMSSLFPSGPPPTPEQRARLGLKRERQLIARREERYTAEEMRLLWQSLSHELPIAAGKVDVDAGRCPGIRRTHNTRPLCFDGDAHHRLRTVRRPRLTVNGRSMSLPPW